MWQVAQIALTASSPSPAILPVKRETRVLERLWHNPRTGPFLLLPLVVAGAAALAILLVVPLAGLLSLIRTLVGSSTPNAVLSWPPFLLSAGAWIVILILRARMRRVGAANAGLVWSAELRVQRKPRRDGGRPRRARPMKLAAGLLATLGDWPDHVVGAPIREDYGAGFWVSNDRDSFWVAIGEAGAGVESDQFLAIVRYDPGLSLRRRLSRIADRTAFARLAAEVDAGLRRVRGVTIERADPLPLRG